MNTIPTLPKNYQLTRTPDGLGLQKTGDSTPLIVDFSSGPIKYRRRHATIRREALARAVGLKGKERPVIVDATAGLGQDSFILATLGCEVYLFERSAVIHALLEDGLKRAREDHELAPIIKRMHLIHGDALTGLDHLPIVPEVIYLDPMFPEKSKSALARKSMQMFHDIAGEDPDADQLLAKALSCAAHRVVVKRPRLSPCLAGFTPDFSLTGTSCRFDGYLTRNSHGNNTLSAEHAAAS